MDESNKFFERNKCSFKKRLSTGRLLSSIFSIHITLIPITQYYKSPINGLNFATFLTILLFPLLLFGVFVVKKSSLYRISMIPAGGYFFAVVINVIICNYLYSYDITWDNYSYFIRFIVLFVSLLFCGHYYLDVNIVVKTLKILLLLSAVFIVIQTVSYYMLGKGFNIYISALLATDRYNSVGNRFSGLYIEPAHYAQSACLYLCYSLLGTKAFKAKEIALIVVGVLLSGSGQGYLFIGLIYAMWCFSIVFIKKISVKKSLMLMISLILGLVSLYSISSASFFQNATSRLIGINGELGGVALAGRTYTNVLFNRFTLLQKWIGIGFGFTSNVTSGYVNALYLHLFEFGYFGAVILYGILGYIYIRIKGPFKSFVLIYGIMILFAAVATPMDLCFYLSLLSLRNYGGTK